MDLVDSILHQFRFLILTMLIALFTVNPYWLIASVLILLNVIIRYLQHGKHHPTLSISRGVLGIQYTEQDHIKVKIEIINDSTKVFRGEVVDIIPKVSRIWSGSNICLLLLNPGEQMSYEYTVSFPTRGEYIIGPIFTRYHSFGEYHQIEKEFKIYKQLVIVPNPDKVTSYHLQPSILKLIGGVFSSKLVGEGFNFAGIREYQIGDTYRRINWKQTAKNRTLYSNEFEVDRVSNFVIIIDLTEEESSIADSSVRSALGLAAFLMNHRCKVGLVVLSTYMKCLPQKQGKRHLMEMTELLTKINTVSNIDNMDLFKIRAKDVISKIHGDKNQILLFSSLTSVEKVLFLTQELKNKGTLNILTPSLSPLLNVSDPLYSFSKNLVDLRNEVISNYMKYNQIRIFEWLVGTPFDTSVNKWRIKS